VKLLIVKAGGTYSYHWAEKGELPVTCTAPIRAMHRMKLYFGIKMRGCLLAHGLLNDSVTALPSKCKMSNTIIFSGL
jgi:hypothetical protein